MNVNIWIRKEDVSVFSITKGLHVWYWLSKPDKNDVVQISITPDEFAFLEDGIDDEEYNQYEQDYINEIYNKDDEELSKSVDREQEWLIEQYNRNRNQDDYIASTDEIENPHEKDELDKKIKKAKEAIDELKDLMNVTGGEFREWFNNLSERAKKIYRNRNRYGQ